MLNKRRWVYCPNCQHKLFLADLTGSRVRMEVKCHSCKAIDTIAISNEKVYAVVKKEDQENANAD